MPNRTVTCSNISVRKEGDEVILEKFEIRDRIVELRVKRIA